MEKKIFITNSLEMPVPYSFHTKVRNARVCGITFAVS